MTSAIASSAGASNGGQSFDRVAAARQEQLRAQNAHAESQVQAQAHAEARRFANQQAAARGYNNFPGQYQPPAQVQAAPSTIPIKFRTSPFYRVEKALSSATECPRAGQGDRKTVHLGFALTQGQQSLLTAS